MSRTPVLFALMVSLAMLAGCWPVVQSQAPVPAPTATTAPRAMAASAEKSNGAAAKPAAAPTATTKPAASSPAAPAASTQPAVKPSPAPNGATGTTGAAASPPAVVATSVAGLPAVGASPAVSTDSRGAAAPDPLGVAGSAGAVAAANASDTEAVALCGPGAVLSTRAGQMAGKQATIAVTRVEASYQASVRGQPTFLNDAPYPNHVFTAVIWGNARRQFQPPPESWQGKGLCVTGPVELYQQRPQIVVTSPSQLRVAH